MIARSYCDETLPNSRRQTVDQEETGPRLELGMKEILPLQKIQQDTVITSTMLFTFATILATSKFGNDDLDIRYASIDKTTSLSVETAFTYDSKMMLP